MKHCGTRLLETERLILRKFAAGDAEAMYRNWASDSDVTRYLTWPVHASVEVSREILEDWISQYENDNFYQWAIVLKENGDEPIGSISVVGMNDAVEMVHIGYCIGKKWWRQGIMTEALSAVIDFFFDVVGANRVEARYDPNNPNSGAVMKKCGMEYEGTMRSYDKNNQGIVDASWYAILKSDRKKTINVVAAIIERDGKIFATQRGYGDYKDWWEFPGGKIEEGESPEEALAREIREELNAEIKVGRLFQTVEYEYPKFHMIMHCYLCELISDDVELTEHEAAKWLGRDELWSVKWLPSDVEIIEKLIDRVG